MDVSTFWPLYELSYVSMLFVTSPANDFRLVGPIAGRHKPPPVGEHSVLDGKFLDMISWKWAGDVNLSALLFTQQHRQFTWSFQNKFQFPDVKPVRG
jgi:hypothetical protein